MVQALAALSFAASLFGARQQARAARASLRHQQNVARFNEQIAELRLADESRAGTIRSGRHLQAVSRRLGALRPAAAAMGWRADGGDIPDLMDETAMIGSLEARDILEESQRRGWSHRLDAMSASIQGAWAGAQRSSISPAREMAYAAARGAPSLYAALKS